MATIRKRGSRYQAMVRRRYHQETKTFALKQDAETWAKETELKIERNSAGILNSSKKYNFSDIIESYRERCAQSKRGLGRTKENVINRLDRELGHLPAQLQRHHVVNFARARLRAAVKPPTLAMDINYIIAISEHGSKWMELNLSSEPLKQARDMLLKDGHVGRSQERNRRPTPEELELLQRYFNSMRTATIPMNDIMLFAMSSAMRLGEICQIEWQDYDPKEKTVLIRARKNPQQKRDHKIPLVKVGDNCPAEIIEKQRQNNGNDGRIFPFNAASVSASFQRACKANNIKDLRFHDLRHEAISALFEMGLQTQHVMLISGHSNLAQLSRYTNTSPEEVFEHLRKINT